MSVSEDLRGGGRERCDRPSARPGTPHFSLSVLLLMMAVVLVSAVHAETPANVHPRLYFTADDLGALHAKMQEDPTRSLWEEIEHNAKSINSIPQSIRGDPDAVAYDTWMGLTYASFYYAMTGDVTVGTKAKGWLLDVCSWPSWTYPEREAEGYLIGYHTGKIAISVGQAYDWLYPLLTESERSSVRTAIMEKAVTKAYREYNSGVYLGDARGNRIAHSYGGIGVAALAIYHDDPQNPTLSPYLLVIEEVMDEYFDSYDRDGGWSEGVGYLGYGLCDASGALYYAEAEKRVRDNDLSSHPKFRNAMNFPIYFLPPDRLGASDSFGDNTLDGEFSRAAAAWFASTYRNGYAQWYYRNGPTYRFDIVPDFLWYDGAVPEVSPENLPESVHFPDIGWVALRTGWDTDDTLLTFRSGAKFTDHNRPEQNSFMLDALGEKLIIEPAISTHGYSDPNYYPYYSATVSQNTILVNNNPNSQDWTVENYGQPAGSVTGFLSTGFYDMVEGSAADAYPGTLQKFQRMIVFMKPDYFLLFDLVQSSAGSVEFDSLFHTLGASSIHVTGDTVTYSQDGVVLHQKVLAPAGFTYKILQGKPIAVQGVDKPTSYISIAPPLKATGAQFLHVLYPLPAGSPLPAISKVTAGGVQGARISRDDRTETILFNPAHAQAELEGIGSDARQFLVVNTTTELKQTALTEGRTLTRFGRTLFSAGAPATMALRYSSGAIDGKVQVGSDTRMKIFSGLPTSVAVDGQVLSPGIYSYDSRLQLLDFPLGPGEHTILVQQSQTSNHAPEMAPIGERTVPGGEELSITVSATDPDGDPLTYGAQNLPGGATFDKITHSFRWTPKSTQVGTYQVTFTVTDGSLDDSETIRITVKRLNHAPVISTVRTRTVMETRLLRFVLTASDADGDRLEYSASGLPSGATFNPDSHEFSWRPAAGQAGKYTVVFTVSDGSLSTSASVTITVKGSTLPVKGSSRTPSSQQFTTKNFLDKGPVKAPV